MLEVRENERLQNAYRVVALIGGAFALSMLGYALVVEWWARTQPQLLGEDAQALLTWLRPAALVLALGMFAAAILLRRYLLGAGVPLARGVMQAMVPAERLQTMLRAVLIGFALSEGGAVLGLLLFFLSGDRADFYVLLGASLLMLAWQFPRPRQWQQWYGWRNTLR